MMNLAFYSKLYLLTIPIFFAIDIIWLGFIARNFYKDKLGHLLSPDVNWVAAFVFYFIYIIGILYFAVLPAIEVQSATKAITLGALFGFFTYATYDLTNLATLKDWPIIVTFVDIIWGMVLCASVAFLSYQASLFLRH